MGFGVSRAAGLFLTSEVRPGEQQGPQRPPHTQPPASKTQETLLEGVKADRLGRQEGLHEPSWGKTVTSVPGTNQGTPLLVRDTDTWQMMDGPWTRERIGNLGRNQCGGPGSPRNVNAAQMLAKTQGCSAPFEALTLHRPLPQLKCNPSKKQGI